MHCDATIFEHAPIDLIEPRQLLVFGRDEPRPVVGGLGNRPAKAGGVGQLLGEVGTVDQELFRDAAAQDAGATDQTGLAECNLGPVAAGSSRSGDPARASTNGH